MWFLRKPPGLRLRLGGPLGPDLLPVLEDILGAARDAGELAARFPSVYEPETYTFGGPAAIEAVHRYHDADTRLYAAHQRLLAAQRGRLSPVALCLAVLSDLFERATGDADEAWDVWCNLEKNYADLAAAPAELPPFSLAAARAGAGADDQALLAGYADANARLAADLDALWRRGALLWGRRAILPPLAAFVFNRHALPGPTIAAIVRGVIRQRSPKRTMVGAEPDPPPPT